MRPGRPALLGALLLAAFGAVGATCPTIPPPAVVPLPASADPPPRNAIRSSLSAGVGSSDLRGQVYAGGAARGSYSPLPGMIVGIEMGGGGRNNTAAKPASLEQETAISTRVFAGYGLWIFRRYLSFTAELGFAPGLHSEYGGFVGPDATVSFTAGGRKWWALTLGYRFAYVQPTRLERWSAAMYHLAALTVIVPRHAHYGFLFQVGLHGADVVDSREHAFGLGGVLGFRLDWDLRSR